MKSRTSFVEKQVLTLRESFMSVFFTCPNKQFHDTDSNGRLKGGLRRFKEIFEDGHLEGIHGFF